MRQLPSPPSPAILFDLLGKLAEPSIDACLAVVIARCTRLVEAMSDRDRLESNDAEEGELEAAAESENHAFVALQGATDDVFRRQIDTLTQLRAQLALIIATGQAGTADEDEFPWTQLRRLLAVQVSI